MEGATIGCGHNHSMTTPFCGDQWKLGVKSQLNLLIGFMLQIKINGLVLYAKSSLFSFMN